jgi:hypothetical protein
LHKSTIFFFIYLWFVILETRAFCVWFFFSDYFFSECARKKKITTPKHVLRHSFVTCIVEHLPCSPYQRVILLTWNHRRSKFGEFRRLCTQLHRIAYCYLLLWYVSRLCKKLSQQGSVFGTHLQKKKKIKLSLQIEKQKRLK